MLKLHVTFRNNSFNSSDLELKGGNLIFLQFLKTVGNLKVDILLNIADPDPKNAEFLSKGIVDAVTNGRSFCYRSNIQRYP